jgi:RNA polymerase sigma factor (sigma-70 family)
MFAHASVSGLRLRVFGDDGLVRLLVAGGSERAFAALYERHHRALYRYCRSIVRDEHDAQDVLQTTMARAFGSLRKGPPDAPLRAWLFRIAHNEAISLLRARRPTAPLDEADHFAGSSVEGSVEERMRLALLVADLGYLPERQRSALVMRELSGLSHAEIACALGVSLSGAKQAICEARVGLQEFAKGREMGCAEIQRLISDADGRKLRGRAVRAHLRSCGDCRALADAIGQRRCDLAALAPALPAATAPGLLARLFGGGGHASGGGATATAAATTGKATSGALAGKLAAGAVVLATVAVGAPNIVEHVSKHSAAGANHSTPAVRGAPAPSPTAPGRATSDHGVRSSGSADARNSAADRHRRSASGGASPESARRSADTPRVAEPGAVTTDSPVQAVEDKAVDFGSSCCAPTADGNPSTSPPAADGNSRSANEPTRPGPNASAHARPAPATRPKLGRETEPFAPPTPTSTATPSSIPPGDTAPTTPPSGKPTTPASGNPAAPASGTPTTPASGNPAAPASGKPAAPASGNPTAPASGNPSASGTRTTSDRPLTNQGG